MKRLLGLLGLTCLVVLTACFYLGEVLAEGIAVVSLLSFVGSMLITKVRKNKSAPVMFITALLAVSLFMGYTHLYINPIQNNYDGLTADVKATRISEVYYSGGYYCYELDVLEVDSQEVDFRMILRSKETIFSEPYDVLEFNAELSFGAHNIDPSKKIFLQSWIPRGHNVKVTKGSDRPLGFYISKLRENMCSSLYMEMDYETADFSGALLLGDNHALKPQVKGLLRNTGLSHIAVVSGLHLSVMGVLLKKIFGAMFKNRYAASAVTIAGVLCFAVLSGLGVSVIRATVMFIIYTVGDIAGRKSDSINNIGAAALVLTLPNPYSVGDVGMLLSFAATLGIVLWRPCVYSKLMQKVSKISAVTRFKWIYKGVKLIVDSFSCSLCATLWTLPISVLTFGGFSLVSLIANILVVPFMVPLIFCMGLCLVTHYVGFLSLLSRFLGSLVSVFYDYIIFICELLSRWKFSYVYVDGVYCVFWVIATVILVLISYYIRKRFVRVLSVLLSIFILFASASVFYLSRKDIITLHVPNTGSGVSVLLESSDGYAVLGTSGSISRCDVPCNIADSIFSTGNDVMVALPGYNSDNFSRNLINGFDYNTVLRYDNGNALYSETLCESEIVFSEKYYLDLWGKADVTLIPCNNLVFVYVTAGDVSVLIVPRYADCGMLDREYLCADAVVSAGCVKNANMLDFDTLIAPGDGKYDDESIAYLMSKAETVIRGNNITYDINWR